MSGPLRVCGVASGATWCSTLFLVLVATMASAQNTPEPPGEALWRLAGPRSAITAPRYVVVRDAVQFARLWKEHQPPGMEMALPKVDFSRHDVVAVFAGSRPTGGYMVEIGKVRLNRGRAEIPATIWKPAPGMIVTQAFTYPFAMQAVPKLPRTARFVVSEKARDPLP